MPELPEYVVNVKLAEILSELGLDARAERVRGRRRPDIRCFYKGLIIGIEVSYDRTDAERDAEKRIDEGLVDIAIALHLKERYVDVPETMLYNEIKKSRFDVKVLLPRDMRGTLTPFIERSIAKKAEAVTEWFTDVDIPTLGDIIRSSVDFLLREEEVAKLLSEVRNSVSNFVASLSALDSSGVIRRNIYDILYRLYGLSVAEAQDPEVAFGHAALSILLSATFYEHIRSNNPSLAPLSDYVSRYGALQGLRKALEDMLKIDYKAVAKAAIDILNVLPSNAEHRVRSLVDLAMKLAASRGLLRRDFAGRVYHEITGDIALRKGFATFYTEVPAAYLLASLAVQSLLNLDSRDIFALTPDEATKIVNRIGSIRVGDFACGSGTLLTASYSMLTRIATMMKYYYDLEDTRLDEVGKRLIEEGIYGIDALRYAAQITAINLALLSTSLITKENVYTIYLGYIPEKKQAWLGSLELLNDGERVGGLLAYIEGWLGTMAQRVTIEESDITFSLPRKFDIVIMNPPFTRATGRTERFGSRRGLFGFVTDENTRRELGSAFNRVRERVRNDLLFIARLHRQLFPEVIQEVIGGREELDQYLAIGQAGEGLLFLYLAYKYTDNNGVIAFVLPRDLLAGVSWFLARVLLASKTHLKYVVVSSDSEKGYNFSEGTSLSETLIVARVVERHEENEETVFINLLRKPSTAIEAMMLAEEIKKRARSIRVKEHALVSVGGSSALIFKVGRKQLLENVDNWNRFVAVLDPQLVDLVTTYLMGNNEIVIGDLRIRVPLTRLNNLVETLGIDRRQFHDSFNNGRTPTPYPILYGGEEEVRSRILVKPNSYAFPKNNRAEQIFRKYSSRVLIPERIWWDTAHAIALYCEQPALSNIFYAVKLRMPEDVRDLAEKAFVLWLNSTWGILTVLFNREETRGRWTSLKMAHWRLLPVLDISKLETNKLMELAKIFDKYGDKPLRRIPMQFNPSDPDPVRLGIDTELLKVFAPELDESRVKSALIELYRKIHNAFSLWVA